MMFAGMATAVLAAVAALVAVPLGGGLIARPPSPDTIRRSMAAAPIAVVHGVWKDLAQSGLDRPPSPEEVRYARFTSVARGVSRVLWGVSAAAAVLAAASFAARAARGRGDAAP
jgi:hypothetical protein